MTYPLVSICMTVYNGEEFLEEALTSLLNQDYPHIEVIILDNLSRDGTREICLRFAERDKRIRYIVDSQPRNGHDAATHIASFARGGYYMPACDDDLWDRSYVTKLVAALENEKSVGLVYSNGYVINRSGESGDRPMLSRWTRLRAEDSRLGNFLWFLMFRPVVPVALGVYRTSVFKAALPFATLDASVADVDNLFILKLLTLTRVACLDERLLYYRVYDGKNRMEDPKYGKYPAHEGRIALWRFWAKHHWRFMAKLLQIAWQSPLTATEKALVAMLSGPAIVAHLLVLPACSRVKRRILRKRPDARRSPQPSVR
jgi:glycosyltransferase involved in cell wall biosynthesis